MKLTVRLAVVVAGLSLAACFNDDHIDVANMTPSGTAFQAELHKGYSELSRVEYDEGDWSDGYRFSTKARQSAEGQEVMPELVWDWDLPEDTVDEFFDARDTIGFWMRMGADERAPAPLANMQVMYDCWIQEQEENYQPQDIARCRDGFYAAVADTEEAMAYQAVPFAPMPMPEPTPRPVAEEPTGVPRFYTIFFDWDKSNINPVAQRVIDAIVADWRDAPDSLQLVGHADRSGAEDYNQRLSERRVASVTQALAAQGISETRLSGYGVGESDPAVPTPDGVREPRNRRVVVTLQ
jgi:OOP family OmpA-OmpF porin